MTSYQALLRIPVVHDLCSKSLEEHDEGVNYGKRENERWRSEIVHISDTYYLRTTEGLIKIQPNARGLPVRMDTIFNTFKYYAEHSDDPYAVFFDPTKTSPCGAIVDRGPSVPDRFSPVLLNILYSTRPTCIPDPPPYSSS